MLKNTSDTINYAVKKKLLSIGGILDQNQIFPLTQGVLKNVLFIMNFAPYLIIINEQ